MWEILKAMGPVDLHSWVLQKQLRSLQDYLLTVMMTGSFVDIGRKQISLLSSKSVRRKIWGNKRQLAPPHVTALGKRWRKSSWKTFLRKWMTRSWLVRVDITLSKGNYVWITWWSSTMARLAWWMSGDIFCLCFSKELDSVSNKVL